MYYLGEETDANAHYHKSFIKGKTNHTNTTHTINYISQQWGRCLTCGTP